MASSPARSLLRESRAAGSVDPRSPSPRPGEAAAQPDPQTTRPQGDKRLPNAQARTAALQATLADLTARRSDAVKEFAAVPSVAEKLLSTHTTATDSTTAAANAEPPDASAADQDAAVQAAKDIIQHHIRRLNAYNEIRDVGQELMGIIAESRGVRIKEVQEDFGISAND